MLRRSLIKSALATGFAAALPGRGASTELPNDRSPAVSNNRAFWLKQMQRVATPVLSTLSQGKLRGSMPVEMVHEGRADRRLTSPLEAFARTLAGIAPWLELSGLEEDEGKAQIEFRNLSRKALVAGVDPQSPDYLQFGAVGQTLVDAGFLALAVLRSPHELNANLDSRVRKQLADALRATRTTSAAREQLASLRGRD